MFRDAAAGHHDHIFINPGGNPNTSTQTTTRMAGTVLSFGPDQSLHDGGCEVEVAKWLLRILQLISIFLLIAGF